MMSQFIRLGHKWTQPSTTTTLVSICMVMASSDISEVAIASQTKSGDGLGPRVIRRIFVQKDVRREEYEEACKSTAFGVSQEYAVQDGKEGALVFEHLLSHWSLGSDEVQLISYGLRHGMRSLGREHASGVWFHDWLIWDSMCLGLSKDWPVKRKTPTFKEALSQWGVHTEPGISLQNAVNEAWYGFEIFVREAQQASELVSPDTRKEKEVEDPYYDELYGPTEDTKTPERDKIGEETDPVDTALEALGSINMAGTTEEVTVCTYTHSFSSPEEVGPVEDAEKLANDRLVEARIEALAMLLEDECLTMQERVVTTTVIEYNNTLQQGRDFYLRWYDSQRWATEESVDMAYNWTVTNFEQLRETAWKQVRRRDDQMKKFRYRQRALNLHVLANDRSRTERRLARHLLFDIGKEMMSPQSLERELRKLLREAKHL